MRLTKRENLLRLLRGEEPEWVPVSLNCSQWFGHHQREDSLPSELKGLDYIGALKALDFDIFSRNHDGGIVGTRPNVREEVIKTETPLGQKVVTHLHTTAGTLTQERQEQRAQSTWHDDAFFVKDWNEDGEAFTAYVEDTTMHWDEKVFEKIDAAIEDDGVFNLPVWGSPLKFFHWNFGLEGSCYFVMDEPEDAKRLADLYWEGLRSQLERMAKHPRVQSIIIMDNLDTPFYPPELAKTFG